MCNRCSWIIVILVLCGGCRTTGERVGPRPPGGHAHEHTIEQLAANSDLVVVGNVFRSDSRWVGKKIVTTSHVEPLRVLKGTVPEGGVQVQYLGGTVGVIHQRATHGVTLDDGEVSVLFLAAHPGPVGEAPRMNVVSEHGRIPLIRPGERKSRLHNNRRLVRRLDDIEMRIKKGS